LVLALRPVLTAWPVMWLALVPKVSAPPRVLAPAAWLSPPLPSVRLLMTASSGAFLV